MLGRQAVMAHRGCERLFESQGQSILVAAGDERGARRRADGGIRVGLRELDARSGEAIDVWGGEIAAAVAGKIGVAEIVGHDEDDVRLRAGGGDECKRGGSGRG